MKTIATVLLVFALASAVQAQNVPDRISYQGVLTDGSGNAIADGSYDITFSIYTSTSGGSALWTETDPVFVVGGIFNLVIGTVNPIDLPFDQTYYLGVSVDGGAEMSPRRELTTTPYAFNSRHVQGQYNVFGGDGNVGIGTTTPAAPLEVKRNTIDANSPAISIDNDTPGGADIIDFKNNGVTKARIRYMSGGSLYIGQLGNNRVIFITNNTNQMTLDANGSLSVGPSTTPVEKLDVDGAIKIGSTGGTNAGTIRWTGLDFEGYDGSSWVSLTSGGSGSLPAGTSGQTLRHNGSSWVANNAIHNNGTYIGIGTVTPTAKLNVGGGQWDLNGTEGDFKIGDDTYRLKIGVATGGAGAGTAGIRVAGGAERLILGAGSTEALTVRNSGEVSIGSLTQDGQLRVYHSGVASAEITATTNTHGGQVYIWDENGNNIVGVTADTDGTGGFMYIRRSETQSGFSVSGNYAGSEEPYVSITGSARSAVLRMDIAGNNSVQLPGDAIASAEMLDEAGVVGEASNVNTPLTGGYDTILSRTITAPATGYALVIATAQAQVGHVTGTNSQAEFGVSDAAGSYPANQDVLAMFPTGAPTGTYALPVTVHGLFEVTSTGDHTFYFIAREASGTWTTLDVQLSVVFLPTSYGSVIPTEIAAGAPTDASAPARAPMTAADVAAERAESTAANRARIERELAEMRERLQRVESELAAEREGR